MRSLDGKGAGARLKKSRVSLSPSALMGMVLMLSVELYGTTTVDLFKPGRVYRFTLVPTL